MNTEQFREFVERQNAILQQLMENLKPITTSTTATITPPKPLDVESADINVKWDNFRSDFEGYCSISGIDKYPAEREKEKLQLFLLFVGDAAKEKYKNFDLSEEDKIKPIKEILDIVEKKVKKEQSILLERLKFFALKQNEEEPYDDYVKRVEKAAKMCNFVNITEEKIIRDRVIFGSYDESLIKKLFEKKEAELTLEEVKKLGETSEATAKFMKTVNRKEHTVQKVQAKQGKNEFCKYCGEKHKKGTKFCGAFGKTCSFCNGKNHIEKVCYKKKTDKEGYSEKKKKLKN